jgi:hypothetical protein
MSERESRLREEGDGWQDRWQLAPREDYGRRPWGLLVTGLVVAGLGVLAWKYVAPDLRRYLKIHNM